MRKRGRAGGTVTNVIIWVFLIFLIVNAAYYYYYLRSLDPHFNSTASTTTSVITTVTSNGSVTSITTTTDNMSLAQLQSLSFANSKCDGLLDPKYWDTAIQASGKTTVTIIPNTVYDLSESYNGWTNFFRSNMSNPPAWISLGLGNYTSAFVNRLAAEVMGTHDITQAAAVMKNYTSYMGGLGAAGLDFVSWGGLSALKVYTGTGNATFALGETFPVHLHQLYALSQDCSYSEQQRAEFLGTALAMTALILATSGKDGFGPKFEGLLTKLGLRDAWAGIKGYLKDIADTSPGAGYETTMALEAMAKKFPSAKFADLASFTSSRIANMVQVLKEKGLSADEISQKVAEPRKAVEESDDEGHVAKVADKISYEYEGSLRVTINTDRAAEFFSQGGRRYITASFLESILPDFKVGEATALKVTVHKGWMKLPSYHVYEGGKTVGFALPPEEVRPGDEVGLSFELLPVASFARSIPDFTLTNSAHLKWLGVGAVLKDFKVVDGVLEFRVLQSNQWSSAQEFIIKGEVVKYPGESNRHGSIYAEFSIKDYAGRETNLRVWRDGFSSEGLQLVEAEHPRAISLISYDGFRLSILSRSGNSVATIYLKPPSESIYSVATIHPYLGPYLDPVQGKYTNAWQIDNVVMLRDLEKAMLVDGSTYDLGRLGSEISYIAGDKELGLKNLIIQEPAMGGRDLYTQDNTVAIQTRFLKGLTPDNKQTRIENALFELAKKLQDDYRYQDQMRDSYAVLSYLDTNDTVKTIILEVPKW